MPAPHVYRAITAISKALSCSGGIAKLHRNARDDYPYRSIDDILNRLSPLLAKHRLCVLPRVLERTLVDRLGEADQLLVSVTLKVAFELVSTSDASMHIVEAYGEALDPGDKATAKAMSSAYKAAMLQTFCVPVAQIDEPDADSHRLKRRHDAEPVEGWEQWTAGITDILCSCQSAEALSRVQDRYRTQLLGLSRERPDLYSTVGATFATRSEELDRSGSEGPLASKLARSKPTPSRQTLATSPQEDAHVETSAAS